MVQGNEENCNDGADEKMLQNGDHEAEKLTLNNELKVFKSNQNGDAKIDIGADDEKVFTGLTKEQLKQYANDPFWVRMRWFLFILFWLLWVAMLVGAIYIILNSPKCNTPLSRAWHQQGPIIKIDDIEHVDSKLEAIKDVQAKGVVYELQSTDTYAIDKPDVQDKIKKLVDAFGSNGIHVIIDLMADSSVQDEDHSKLNASIQNLVSAGIKGIRFRDIDLPKETVKQFSDQIHNATEGEGFALKLESTLPKTILKLLQENIDENTAKSLFSEIKKIHEETTEHSSTEFEYTRDAFKVINGSEFNMFIMLLPGTPIVPIDTLNYENESLHDIHMLQKFRDSASYQHGNFKIYLDANQSVIGYTWYKIGNPAYFVVFNPNNAEVTADFSHVEKISTEVTVVLKSHAYNIPDIHAKSKLPAHAIKMAPRSTLVLTFVPKSAE